MQSKYLGSSVRLQGNTWTCSFWYDGNILKNIVWIWSHSKLTIKRYRLGIHGVYSSFFRVSKARKVKTEPKLLNNSMTTWRYWTCIPIFLVFHILKRLFMLTTHSNMRHLTKDVKVWMRYNFFACSEKGNPVGQGTTLLDWFYNLNCFSLYIIMANAR